MCLSLHDYMSQELDCSAQDVFAALVAAQNAHTTYKTTVEESYQLHKHIIANEEARESFLL